MRIAALVDHWPMVAVAIIFVALFAAWWQRRRTTRPATMAEHMQSDARDPVRRWIQAAFRIVSGESDYGYVAKSEAHRMLVRWWQVHGPRDHARVLDELEESGRRANAWDLVRYMVVTRLGAAVGYLDQEQSWAMLVPVAQRLQDAYDDWPDLAAAYLNARRQWKGQPLDGSEDDRLMLSIVHNIASLRETTWPLTPFHCQLSGSYP